MNGSLVIGRGVAAPSGTLITLALRIADYARKQGLRLMSIRRSRQTSSESCYLALLDAARKLWIIRVSDHYRPRKTTFPVPHFDLISRDGVSGFPQACKTIDAMIDGSMPWHDAEQSVRMPRSRKIQRPRDVPKARYDAR